MDPSSLRCSEEQFFEFPDDESCVAVDVPSDRQDGYSTVLDPELFEDGTWESVQRDALEVFESAESKPPVHLPSERGSIICE